MFLLMKVVRSIPVIMLNVAAHKQWVKSQYILCQIDSPKQHFRIFRIKARKSKQIYNNGKQSRQHRDLLSKITKYFNKFVHIP